MSTGKLLFTHLDVPNDFTVDPSPRARVDVQLLLSRTAGYYDMTILGGPSNTTNLSLNCLVALTSLAKKYAPKERLGMGLYGERINETMQIARDAGIRTFFLGLGGADSLDRFCEVIQYLQESEQIWLHQLRGSGEEAAKNLGIYLGYSNKINGVLDSSYVSRHIKKMFMIKKKNPGLKLLNGMGEFGSSKGYKFDGVLFTPPDREKTSHEPLILLSDLEEDNFLPYPHLWSTPSELWRNNE